MTKFDCSLLNVFWRNKGHRNIHSKVKGSNVEHFYAIILEVSGEFCVNRDQIRCDHRNFLYVQSLEGFESRSGRIGYSCIRAGFLNIFCDLILSDCYSTGRTRVHVNIDSTIFTGQDGVSCGCNTWGHLPEILKSEWLIIEHAACKERDSGW